MAVATSAKANGTGGSATLSCSTGLVSVANGETLIAFYVGYRSIGGMPTATIADTAGLTWTEINAGGWTYDPGSNPRILIQAFWAKNTTGATVNTTITCTGGSSSGTLSSGVGVIGITGNGTAFTNFAQGTNAAGDPAPSLPSAPATGSAVVGCAAFAGSVAITPPTGFAELQEFQAGSTSRLVETISDDTSPAQSATWSTTNTNASAVLIEVPVPPAGSNKFFQLFG